MSTTLHLLSHSPFGDTRQDSCLRIAGPEDAVLLSGEAVYALLSAGEPWRRLQSSGLPVYALEEDVLARGLEAGPGVTMVDYPAFVRLTLTYDKVNSWL